MKKIRKSAFTLVEIMIVVAIIGLLAAITIPNFIKAREASVKNVARGAAATEYEQVYKATLTTLTSSSTSNAIPNLEANLKATAAAETASNTLYWAKVGAILPHLTNGSASIQ